jgi:hypothetical protein
VSWVKDKERDGERKKHIAAHTNIFIFNFPPLCFAREMFTGFWALILEPMRTVVNFLDFKIFFSNFCEKIKIKIKLYRPLNFLKSLHPLEK